MRKPCRNYIRAEVNRMPWPEVIADDEGDEIARLRRGRNSWRAFALYLLALIVVLMLVDMLGG